MPSLISLSGIDELITHHGGKPGTLRYRFLAALRAGYAEDGQTPPSSSPDELIALLWNAPSDEVNAKRKAFSSLKSATNKFLKDLANAGENPESIIISRDNTFTISEERKDNLIKQVGISADTNQSMLDMFAAFNKLVKEMVEQQGQDQAQGLLDQLEKTRHLVQALTGKQSAGEERSQSSSDDTTEPDGLSPESGTTGAAQEEGDQENLSDRNQGSGQEPLNEAFTEDTELFEVSEEELADTELIEEAELPAWSETTEEGKQVEKFDKNEEFDEVEEVIKEESPILEQVEETLIAGEEIVEMEGAGNGEELNEGNGTGSYAGAGNGPTDLGTDTGLLAEDAELVEFSEEELADTETVQAIGPPAGPEPIKKFEEIEGIIDEDLIATGNDDFSELVETLEEVEQYDEAEEFEEIEISEEADMALQPDGSSDRPDLVAENELLASEEELVEIVEDETAAGDALAESESGDTNSETSGKIPDRPRMFDLLSDYLDPYEALDDKQETLREPREEYIAQILARFTPKFITIPEDEYLIGTKTPKGIELPLTPIHLNLFHIGQYPITNDLFELFIRDTGYETDAEQAGYGHVFLARCTNRTDTRTGRKTFTITTGISGHRVSGANWRHPTGPTSSLTNKHNHPVVQVSRRDAKAFAAWAGKRLPTEEEWEAAGRGRDSRLFPWGNTWYESLCNLESAGLGDTTPVDHFGKGSASPFAIFDLLGNVHEWTNSIYQKSATIPGIMADNLVYILKGGCWTMRGPITLASRHIEKGNYWANIIGFRCVA